MRAVHGPVHRPIIERVVHRHVVLVRHAWRGAAARVHLAVFVGEARVQAHALALDAVRLPSAFLWQATNSRGELTRHMIGFADRSVEVRGTTSTRLCGDDIAPGECIVAL